MTSHSYFLRSISESTPLLQMNNSDPLLNLNSSSTTLNTASIMSHSTSHSTKTLLTPSNFKCISSPLAELQESSSTLEISFDGSPAFANPPAQVMTLLTSSLPFTFPSPSLAPLRFSTIDVPLWFQRFHARFRKFQMSDEDLYYELLNCLDDSHLHKYPQSNGLAERYIKNIKTALTAKLDSSHWTRHLPLIILSINIMYKADLKCSSAELVFGQTLRLPGDLCCNSPQPRIRHPSDMVLAMRKFTNSCQPIDTKAISSKPVHLSDALQTCTHVFIRNDPIKANLTPSYDGPFLVLSRTKHSFTVLRCDKLYTAAINNIKPEFTLPPLEHLESIFPNCQTNSTPYFARPYNFRHTCNVPSRFQNDYVMYSGVRRNYQWEGF